MKAMLTAGATPYLLAGIFALTAARSCAETLTLRGQAVWESPPRGVGDCEDLAAKFMARLGVDSNVYLRCSGQMCVATYARQGVVHGVNLRCFSGIGCTATGGW